MLTVSLAGRDLLRISDLAPADAEAILDLAVQLREDPRQPLLSGATLGLYFSKHSTRTRVSFSVAMTHLGGTAISLTPDELQLSRGESLPDTARALSRYLDALAAPEAFVMHCLPAHPGEEITADVLYGERSAIWDEAENRLHVQKALLVSLLG